MPNSIKYSTTGDTLSLRKGNLYFGTGDVGKGPSSVTQHYNGVTPNGGGYTIYFYDPRQPNNIGYDPISSDVQLISYTNGISGQNFTGATQCFNWYATQTNYTCINKDYEGIVTNGLVLNLDAGFLPSYSTSGNTWYDLAYSGNNGTLVSGVTYSSLDGGSLVFDGTDDYVDFGNTTSLTITGNSISLEAWVNYNLSQQDWKGVLYKANFNSTGYQLFIDDSEKVAFGLITTSGFVRPAANFVLPPNTWHHIMGTYDGSNMRTYINGTLYNTTTQTGNILASSTSLNVGRSFSSEEYPGYIPVVRIYNRGLTTTEVLQNYNAGLSRFNTPNIVKSNLVLNLDASNSVSYPTTGTTWTDLSGDGYNGTLTNGPTFDSTSKSIVFDGVDDIVVLTGTTNVNYTTNISIEYVFKYNSAPTGYAYHILTKGKNTLTNTSFVDYLLKDFGGVRLMYSANAGGTWKTISKYSQPLSANTWYHACWTYDSTLGSNLYVNTIVATGGTSGAGVLATNTEPIRIGDVFYGGHSFFNGNVDYVRIYDRTLSQSEVLQNYYGGPIVTSGLIMALDAGNLVSYSGTGTTWKDLTSNNYNGILTNGPTYSSSNGGTIVFDGVNDFINISGMTFTSNSPFNINTWVYYASGSGLYPMIMAADSATAALKMLFGINIGTGGKFGYNLFLNYLETTNTSAPSTNQWYNVVANYDGTNIKLYINGTLISTSTSGTYTGFTGITLGNGSNGNNSYWKGNISIAQIYNRSLSPDEIGQNFNAYKSRFGL